jgi:hypothetical protein
MAVALSAATLASAQTPSDEDNIENEIDIESAGELAPDPGASTDTRHESDTDNQAPAAELTPAPSTPSAPSAIETRATPPPYAESEKASSSSGEKIFDWSKHKGESEVAHPFAEKGLIRITKDKTYIYRVSESKQNHAADFRVGMFNPVNLHNPDATEALGSSFDDNYQTDNPALMFDYEWQMWRTSIGKFGLRAGSGLYVAQGNGHFVHPSINPGKTPREVFTFVMIPANFGAVYRMQLWHRQLLIPYVEGGGSLFGFAELRDDDKAPKWGGSAGAYYAGGAALNLTYFDALSRIQLDREYGINAVYLTVEYRGIVALSNRYDFSGDLFNAGVLMEY